MLLATCGACDARPVHPLDAPEVTPETATAPPPPPVELGQHAVAVVETRQIVPSSGIPSTIPVRNSNNNLDVVRHRGRVFLAWRTAPDHFASPEARIVVVSSEDERAWRFETSFAVGTDLREPRLLSLGGDLFLYVARLGTDPQKFQPAGVSYARLRPDGAWSELAPVLRRPPGGGAPTPMDGAIAWRTKPVGDGAWMSAYLGGEHIYTFDGMPLDVELLASTDGVVWTGVDPSNPSVYHGGGSEMDFALTADRLYAVIRNEAGDATGYGSKVCTAPAATPARWTCKSDPRKYDSPHVFVVDDEVYLLGRRNLSASGNYDLGTRDDSIGGNAILFQLDYRRHKKRCALWRYVRGEDRIAYVLDLPSRGDTCFASTLAGSTPEERTVYDYSSAIDGPDVTWAEGQVGPTHVYRHVLRFTKR